MPPLRLVSPSTIVMFSAAIPFVGAGLAKAAHPLVIDDHVGETAEEGQPAVALADEMVGGEHRAAMIVGRDGRHTAGGQAAHGEDDRDAAC